MKVAVVGTGYVGLVAGACFAESGNDVVCVDKDDTKIRTLKRGKMPIYEPGLEELVRRNRQEGRLSFTTMLPKAVRDSTIIFIAVGTPQDEDGSADLKHVLGVAAEIAKAMSRSYTSRAARVGEADGVDYNFISTDRFESMIRNGAFLEWADVFGSYYGTSAADTEAVLAGGDDVVLVIDVQGARQVRSRGIESVGIFVLPPSAAILEQRLRGRSKDSEDQIQRRLQVARREVDEYARYDYVVVNDEVESAVDRLRAIIMAERARVTPMRDEAESIIRTFA